MAVDALAASEFTFIDDYDFLEDVSKMPWARVLSKSAPYSYRMCRARQGHSTEKASLASRKATSQLLCCKDVAVVCLGNTIGWRTPQHFDVGPNLSFVQLSPVSPIQQVFQPRWHRRSPVIACTQSNRNLTSVSTAHALPGLGRSACYTCPAEID